MFLAWGVPQALLERLPGHWGTDLAEIYNGVPETPWELIAYGRNMATNRDQADCLFVGEGMNSSVAVTQLPSGIRNFHVSGKIEASSESQDMRLQRMLGHIPAAFFHPHPHSVLIVGAAGRA